MRCNRVSCDHDVPRGTTRLTGYLSGVNGRTMRQDGLLERRHS